jgi:hypothetical protein
MILRDEVGVVGSVDALVGGSDQPRSPASAATVGQYYQS